MKALAKSSKKSASATAVKADPIFGAIAAHRKAARAAECAKAALTQRENEVLKAENWQPGSANAITSIAPVMILRGAYDFRNPRQIKRHVEEHLSNAAYALGPKAGIRIKRLRRDAVREIQSMYDKNVAAHFRRRRTTGISPLYETCWQAASEERKALKYLVSLHPKTPAGVAALVEYLAEVNTDELDGPKTARHIAALIRRMDGPKTARHNAAMTRRIGA